MRSRKTSDKPKSLTPKDCRYAKHAPKNPPQTNHSKATESVLPEQEISFAELDNGSLVETIEDPADSKVTALAIFRNGRIRIATRLVYKSRVLIPIPRMAAGFSEMKLPRGSLRYRSAVRLFYEIFSFIRYAVDLPVEHRAVAAAFGLYTYFADRLPTAVYLSLVGLPQSGKSTLLEVLNMICRRPILVSNISNAALYGACSRYHPTLLIDEIEWHSSATTSTLRQLLRAGTGSSAQVLRVGHSAVSFGPKVVCSLEPCPDPALSSRCVVIPMAETDKTGLLRPHDPRMVKLASDIRQKLLQFRLALYKSIRPVLVPGAEELRPRSRDMLSSLAAPLARSSKEQRLLLEFFKLHQDPSTREPLPVRQDPLVAVVFGIIHLISDHASVRIGGRHGLTENTNAMLLGVAEPAGVTDKACGSMLLSLGFRNKQRTNRGWILWLDSSTRDRCHQLIKTYGNCFVTNSDVEHHAKSCPACANMLAPRPKSDKPQR